MSLVINTIIMSNTQQRELSFEEYQDALEKHDWFYEMSDDQTIYDAGKFNYARLVSLSDTNKDFKEAFNTVRNKKFKNVYR